MKVIGENIQVDSAPVGPNGEKLEPEERPSAHVIGIVPEIAKMDFDPVKDLNQRPQFEKAQRVLGTLPATMTREAPAGETAKTISEPCHACEYWDRPVWIRRKAELESAVAMKAQAKAALDEMKSYIMQGFGSTDEKEIDRILSIETGLCRFQSDLIKDEAYSWAGSHCPAFKARGMEEERIGNRTRDSVMKAADQGSKAWWKKMFFDGKRK